MAIIKTKYEAEMDDGTVHTVEADQRDLAAYEMSEHYDPNKPRAFTQARFVVYNALRRTGKLKTSWQKFNTDCGAVRVVADEGPDDLDPTNQDLSAED